jgi:hypothetical protein
MTWTAPAYPRVDEPFNGMERATLDGLLDWHRASFLLRCRTWHPADQPDPALGLMVLLTAGAACGISEVSGIPMVVAWTRLSGPAVSRFAWRLRS